MLIIEMDSMDILQVNQEITIKNVEQFKVNLESLLESTQKRYLILDLEKVTYLNSSALGCIADTAMKAKKVNKELVVAGIKPPIDEIFHIVKFEFFMELFKSKEEAVEYFSSK
ncbi:STAS domain-containing protein [Bacillus sp. 31A1R]|uniref:STAS domain-containing protein n=1 Tax=Robertmurraya mangrovi TaxID=3098077 RepID=A0ABU5J442_9BACI|nr:STAS domain-containing protein [Bacillus sp. 31A1R]MDZ5474112.1 STAS domain-containing protein [Bacillus sp. 31A1R]